MARDADTLRANEAVYDPLWAGLPIYPHTAWPTWERLKDEVPRGRVLELGCGALPRTPLQGGYFVDLSLSALRRLADHGGRSVRAGGALPFCDGAFAVVCAFEVLEHIPDDEEALREIARVLAPGGIFFFSVPVDPARYTYFDRVCEHVRRYDAAELSARLSRRGLRIERWCTQPNRFGKVAGWLAGVTVRVAERAPRLLRWLKRKSAENAMQRTLDWREDDIGLSHEEGGLIAIARRV